MPHQRSAPALAIFGLALTLGGARSVRAQTDYYNTDAGRPLQVEDAYAVERRAIEFQAAPLRLERSRRGIYTWGIEPEVALGVLPRTQFEVGLPIAIVDAGTGGRTTGITGLDISALYNFNAETRIPALAVAVGVLAPVGSLAADDTYASVKGIATKTFSWMRFHVNARYTFGREPYAGEGTAIGAGAAELSRWMAGVSVDRALPLQSLLVGAEVFAQQPLHADEDAEWNAAAGTRVQVSPRLAVDFGGGARLTGDDQGWFVTIGGAWVVGMPWRGGRPTR